MAAATSTPPMSASAASFDGGFAIASRPKRNWAEVIASAFAGGLSWRGSLAGKEVYGPPPDFKGRQVMIAFEKFLEENPDMAEKPYGDAMAASLSRAYPCQTN